MEEEYKTDEYFEEDFEKEVYESLVLTNEMVADYFFDAYIDSFIDMNEYFEYKERYSSGATDYYYDFMMDENEQLCNAYRDQITEQESKPIDYDDREKVNGVAIYDDYVTDPSELMKEKEIEFLKDFIEYDIDEYSEEKIDKFLLIIATVHPELTNVVEKKIAELEKKAIEEKLNINGMENKSLKRRL